MLGSELWEDDFSSMLVILKNERVDVCYKRRDKQEATLEQTALPPLALDPAA